MISDEDFALFKVTDDLEEAVVEIRDFYRVFHSYRYVGDKIVVRTIARLTPGAVEQLNVDFGDIVKAGTIAQCDALEEEDDEPELGMLPRLMFRHRRRSFGRLRQFIDAVNAAEVAEEIRAVS